MEAELPCDETAVTCIFPATFHASPITTEAKAALTCLGVVVVRI